MAKANIIVNYKEHKTNKQIYTETVQGEIGSNTSITCLSMSSYGFPTTIGFSVANGSEIFECDVADEIEFSVSSKQSENVITFFFSDAGKKEYTFYYCDFDTRTILDSKVVSGEPLKKISVPNKAISGYSFINFAGNSLNYSDKSRNQYSTNVIVSNYDNQNVLYLFYRKSRKYNVTFVNAKTSQQISSSTISASYINKENKISGKITAPSGYYVEYLESSGYSIENIIVGENTKGNMNIFADNFTLETIKDTLNANENITAYCRSKTETVDLNIKCVSVDGTEIKKITKTGTIATSAEITIDSTIEYGGKTYVATYNDGLVVDFFPSNKDLYCITYQDSSEIDTIMNTDYIPSRLNFVNDGIYLYNDDEDNPIISIDIQEGFTTDEFIGVGSVYIPSCSVSIGGNLSLVAKGEVFEVQFNFSGEEWTTFGKFFINEQPEKTDDSTNFVGQGMLGLSKTDFSIIFKNCFKHARKSESDSVVPQSLSNYILGLNNIYSSGKTKVQYNSMADTFFAESTASEVLRDIISQSTYYSYVRDVSFLGFSGFSGFPTIREIYPILYSDNSYGANDIPIIMKDELDQDNIDNVTKTFSQAKEKGEVNAQEKTDYNEFGAIDYISAIASVLASNVVETRGKLQFISSKGINANGNIVFTEQDYQENSVVIGENLLKAKITSKNASYDVSGVYDDYRYGLDVKAQDGLNIDGDFKIVKALSLNGKDNTETVIGSATNPNYNFEYENNIFSSKAYDSSSNQSLRGNEFPEYYKFSADFIGYHSELRPGQQINISRHGKLYKTIVGTLSYSWDGGFMTHVEAPSNDEIIGSSDVSSSSGSSVSNVANESGIIQNGNSNAYLLEKIQKLEKAIEEINTKEISGLLIEDGSIKSRNITDSAISSSKISDSAIVSSKISDSSITNSKIADSTIEGSKIKFSTFENGVISGSAINTSTFKDGQISGSKIEDSSITGSKIEKSAITGSKIDFSTFENGVIKGSYIDGSTFTDGQIRGSVLYDIPFASIDNAFISDLTADSTFTTKLSAKYADIGFANIDTENVNVSNIGKLFNKVGLIDSAVISEGHITGELSSITVSANSLSAGTIDASDIEVINLNCANLTVGTINGNQIASGAIDLNKFGEDVNGWISTTNSNVSSALTQAGLNKTQIEGVAKNLTDYQSSVQKSIGDLQEQIDGKYESYSEDYEPTLQNYPANEWTTTEERKKHIGDIFYWTSKGYAYRFVQENGSWGWMLIQDTDVTRALEQAQLAQNIANAKKRVFVTTPYPPYDIGDLWTDGANLYKCNVAKADGSQYSSSDWGSATDYTNDATANMALGKANSAKDSIDNLSLGGQNLIRNSNILIYKDYEFVVSIKTLIDNNRYELTDNNGNILVAQV